MNEKKKGNRKLEILEPREMERHHILVYGSLRKGCIRDKFLTAPDSIYIKQVRIPDFTLYKHKGMDYPYAVFKKGEHIICELWEVSEQTKIDVERLEQDYVQRTLSIQLSESRDANSWNVTNSYACSMWIMPMSKIKQWQMDFTMPPLIEIGSDWIKHCKEEDLFCYKPNMLRARKGLPSLQSIWEDKQIEKFLKKEAKNKKIVNDEPLPF